MSHTKPPYIAPVEISAAPTPRPNAMEYLSSIAAAFGPVEETHFDARTWGILHGKIADAVRELSAAKAEAERLREADAILSWLELQHVEVRTPALYGSFPAFKSFSVAGFEGEEDSPSDLRVRVLAALAATRQEEGARVQIEKEKGGV